MFGPSIAPQRLTAASTCLCTGAAEASWGGALGYRANETVVRRPSGSSSCFIQPPRSLDQRVGLTEAGFPLALRRRDLRSAVVGDHHSYRPMVAVHSPLDEHQICAIAEALDRADDTGKLDISAWSQDAITVLLACLPA